VAQNSKEITEFESQNNLPSHQFAKKLFEIDRKYQEQFSLFLNELHGLNSDIERLEKDIVIIKENIAKEEKELKDISAEIKAQLLHLEKLNEKLINKISVAIEMKKINNYSDSYKSIIEELSEDVRELEIDILQKELQKENLQLKLIPSWQKITEIKDKINKLQTQKRYIESLGLNKTPSIPKNQISSNIVDVEVNE